MFPSWQCVPLQMDWTPDASIKNDAWLQRESVNAKFSLMDKTLIVYYLNILV
jgi:hypothetical protein